MSSRPADPSLPNGIDILYHPRLNKGTAFTEAERDTLRIRGLLPPRIFSIAQQQARVLGNLRRKENDLEKYIFLMALQDRNETLFYRTIIDHIVEMMPIIYTPTVGEACRQFGDIFRRPRGLYVSALDRGRVRSVLENWPARDVQVIVATDGERILGLGDLGAQGMGIPIGKLALYTACAGIDPARCLPITIDVGCDLEPLRDAPLYPGLQQPRLRGEAYDALIEEFVDAVDAVFPGVLLQWEDFATENAFRLLNRYRDRLCTFNDDIQGTAGVTLAGLYSASRITGRPLTEQRLLFYGAGSAAAGIANLIVSAMRLEGLSEEEARRRCWFVDTKGLVVTSRLDLQAHKVPFAHAHEPVRDLAGAVEALAPTALLGLSAQPQSFTEPILRAMAHQNERPVIFALSNPTSKAECTAEQAYGWTDGRGVFASGSPFAPVTLNGQTFIPRQGNNAYIFPGLGLGVVAIGARRVTDGMFRAAARTLAATVTEEDLARGSLFPPLQKIREASASIAAEVVREAVAEGLTDRPVPDDLPGFIAARMYEPAYR